MEGLLTFLVFAGVFYLMMRLGCGAHAVHGHAGGHGRDGAGAHGAHIAPVGPRAERADAGRRDIDPVCGKEVAPGQGYAAPFGGREYRLCSRVCLDLFEARPAHYASAQGGAQ